jgi:arylsulfatase A-like enzyme
MRAIRVHAVLLLAALAAACSGAAPRRPADSAAASTGGRQRPNIIVMMSDDHAAHALSAYRPYLRYGAERLPETPNLDRLAAAGMLFVNAFVTNSICGPSRAAVLTGQYGHLNGMMTNAGSFHPTNVTFPQLLRQGGYQTALYGKWHLIVEPTGFDHYEILAGQGSYYNPTLHSERDSARHTGYTSDIVTERALGWLRARDRTKPFLLLLNFNAPHRYWDPGPAQLGLYRQTTFPEPATLWDEGAGRAFRRRDAEMTIELDMFPRDLKLEAPALTPAQRAAWDSAYGSENAAFAGRALTGEALTRWKYQRYIGDYFRVVAGMDANVGRVLEEVERAGLADNTIIVYTSDQGFFLGDHGWFDKRWMYEESLRTPLLVRWPGVVRPGSHNRDLVMNLDLAQTLLEAGGVAAPPQMQGASLVPLLRGRTPADWRDAVYYQYFEYPGWHMVRRQYGVRTDRHKLIHYYEEGAWELFDLERDPEELRSVYADPAYAPTVARLKERLAQLRRQYDVPADDPVPHRPFDPGPGLRRTTGG